MFSAIPNQVPQAQNHDAILLTANIVAYILPFEGFVDVVDGFLSAGELVLFAWVARVLWHLDRCLVRLEERLRN